MMRTTIWDCGSVKNNLPTTPFRFEADSLTLHLHVQPGAVKTGWAGPYGESALKLRLSAPAVDGRANRACLDFLAKAAGVPRRHVLLLRGEKARDKIVRIAPITESQFREIRAQWGTEC